MTDKVLAIAEKPAENGVHIDVTNADVWEIVIKFENLGARNEFLQAAAKYGETGDSTPLFPFCVKYIRRWPFANLNPAKIADYAALTTEQWDEEVEPRLIKALEAFRRK